MKRDKAADRNPSNGNGSNAKPSKKPAKGNKPKDLTPWKRVVEGLLFSSREPLSPMRLASAISDLTTAEVRQVLEKLSAEYKRAKRGFMLEEVAGGYRLVTVPELSGPVRKLHRIRSEDRLSPASLETLSIVAYRQPVIRADIEAIRGVNCGGTLKLLLEKGLIKIMGRADVLGRPLLYSTTKDFLEQFGINSVQDLPRAEEFRSGGS